MNDLKPCPFCGGQVMLEVVEHKHAETYNIFCEECGAEIVRFDKQEVINAWNRRKDESSSQVESDNKELLFDEFWSLFPRHIGKAQAKKAFFKIKKIDEVFPKIKSMIEYQLKTGVVLVKDSQYIPYPATWLNAKYWEDEVVENSDESKYQEYKMQGGVDSDRWKSASTKH